MVAPRLLAVVCLLISAGVWAEPLTYHLNDPAQKYAIEVLFPQPPVQTFDDAPATITLKDKASGAVLQRIDSPEAFALFKPGSHELAPDQTMLVFGDFNFDGQQDMAVRNGNNGGYAEPSYDIYLFDPDSPTLVLNKAFSALTREPQLGLFGVDPAGRKLLTQTKSGCCWRQSATWEIQGNKPVMVAEKIEVAQSPSEGNPFMPKGYVDVTRRELKAGQWVEQRGLEGPIGEPPVMLRGTLDGKIPVELWWQLQGESYVGEVRYTQSGNGQPIRLIGTVYEDGGVQLHEMADDGQMTGDWVLEGLPNERGGQEGTWVSGQRRLSIDTRPTAFKVAAQKLERVAADQREGHYLVSNTDEQRVGELVLKILPGPDKASPEIADITFRQDHLKEPTTEIHHQSPLLAGNLVIALDDKGDPLFRVQLLNGGADVTGYSREYSRFRGAYVKQP